MKLLKSLINKIRSWRAQRAEDQKMLERLEDLTGDYLLDSRINGERPKLAKEKK